MLDIGSNDATSLKAYTVPGSKRIGIDPTGAKFRQYYPDDVALVTDFFSAANLPQGVATARPRSSPRSRCSTTWTTRSASPVRSAEVLSDDGIWHFEQSYMPSMLRMNSYDTICHEHLEYYSLGVVKCILEAAGMKIVDVQMNAVNGGSFAVTAAEADQPPSPLTTR